MIIIFIIGYVTLVYWSKVLVQSPLLDDLNYSCNQLKQSKTIELELIKSEFWQKQVKIINRFPANTRIEIMNDIARSQRIAWRCE